MLPKKGHNGKKSKSLFSFLKYVLDYSESIPIRKFFSRKIVFAIFLTYDPQFFKKGLCPERNVILGKFVEIEALVLKYVQGQFESILIKKYFFEKKSVFAIISSHDPNFSKKWLCPQVKSK